jgi:hypothetical protein
MVDQTLINALFGGPSWLEQANQQRQKDIANYLQGGVPALMQNTQLTQSLAGGFGGTTTGKISKISPAEYRMAHTSPEPGIGSPLHDVSTNAYPADFYGPNGLQYYAPGNEAQMDAASYWKIRDMKDKPEQLVNVWRAIPWEGKNPGYSLGKQHINPGDWVTINRKYAIEHGEGQLGGKYAIAKARVPAKELFTQGDSFHEWGWHPENE